MIWTADNVAIHFWGIDHFSPYISKYTVPGDVAADTGLSAAHSPQVSLHDPCRSRYVHITYPCSQQFFSLLFSRLCCCPLPITLVLPLQSLGYQVFKNKLKHAA
jgi:hypothetical protein